MTDEPFPTKRGYTEITQEAEARALPWPTRFQGEEFHYPRYHAKQYFIPRTRLEDDPAPLGQRSVLWHVGQTRDVGTGNPAAFEPEVLWAGVEYAPENSCGLALPGGGRSGA